MGRGLVGTVKKVRRFFFLPESVQDFFGFPFPFWLFVSPESAMAFFLAISGLQLYTCTLRRSIAGSIVLPAPAPNGAAITPWMLGINWTPEISERIVRAKANRGRASIQGFRNYSMIFFFALSEFRKLVRLDKQCHDLLSVIIAKRDLVRGNTTRYKSLPKRKMSFSIVAAAKFSGGPSARCRRWEWEWR